MNDQQLIPEDVQQRAQQQHLQDQERAEELARRNHDFVQFQRKNMAKFRLLIRNNPKSAQLLMLFAEKMNKQNALMCSFKTLEDITGLSRSTLSKAISILKQENWIHIIKVGTANAYIINREVFWQDSADKKISQFTFGATIIASKSEQGKDYIKENLKDIELRHFPFLQKMSPEDAKPISVRKLDEIELPTQDDLIGFGEPD